MFSWWQWIVIVIIFYAGCLVGANSPQTFKRSKAGLERIAANAAAKAKQLARCGR